ncbi:MAG: hypothetical protein KDA65_00300 [Planctomycetaceae bacterium]|nr:hypothetical protein [Planctomycetaceae bacterium]
MPRQLVITAITTCLLAGIGWLYHQYVNPLLLPPTLTLENRIPETPLEHQLGPIENRELAVRYLEEVEWVQQNPGYQFRLGDQAFVFANSLTRSGKTVRLEPFAMIWVPKQKPGDSKPTEPFTVTCESGSIEFNDEYSFENVEKKLRVVKGQLRGDVKIKGADGLSLRGSSFVYSEEAMSIVCDDKRIEFQYKGTEGVADGLVVNLQIDEALKREGEIPISGVRSLRLRENISLIYQEPFEESTSPEKSASKGPVMISSQGSLIYDLESNIAQLLQNVQIHRQVKPGESEHLYAPEKLTIELMEEEDPDSSEMTAATRTPASNEEEEDDLSQIRRLSATGNPVRLIVEKQELVVETVNLVYDYQTRTALLNGSGGVSAQMEENHLECPELQLIHNEEDDIESVIGLGRGKLVQLDRETNELKFQASWLKKMQFLHDFETDHDIVRLDEQAFFRVPEQNFAASANHLLVRLEEWIPPAPPGSTAKPDGKRQPVYVLAENNVHMQMQQLEARNELTQVWIRDLTHSQAEQLEQKITPPENETPGGIVERHDQPEKESSDSDPYEDPTSVSSEKMEVLVNRIHPQEPVGDANPEEEKPKPKMVVHQADILENVMVKRTSAEANRNLAIAGDQVRFWKNEQGKETITVFGAPAEVQGQQAYLTGNQLQVYTESEQAEVLGPGQLRLEVRKDFEGKDLESPDVLTIAWKEKMAFSEKTASFFGQVVATSKVNQSRIHCQTMHVHFTDTIAFSEEKEGERPDIKLIECLEQVRLFNKEFKGETLTEIRTGQVWELRIYPESGDTESVGPGHFEIWSQDKDKNDLASLSTQSSVMSNKSLTVSGADWDYIRVDFHRNSKGNLRSRTNTFEGGVEMIYGPVQHPQQVVQRSQLSKGSGTMSAQQLDIHQIKKVENNSEEETAYVELLASGNVRLESDTFHARADRVSYEQSKKRYHLRSLGRELVYFWQQEQPGAEPVQTTAKAMTYYPEKGQIDIEKVQSLQGSQ